MPRYVDHQARAAEILEALVSAHIRSAEPVSSEQLKKDCRLDLSSASLRSILASLEEQNLVSKAHASGGRLPTDKGYRRYVQGLGREADLLEDERKMLEKELARRGREMNEALGEANRTLALLSRLMALTVLPSAREETLQRLEFLPLSSSKVLVVLVTGNDQVLKSLISIKPAPDRSALASLSRTLHERFAGRPLDELRLALDRILKEGVEKSREFAAALGGGAQAARAAALGLARAVVDLVEAEAQPRLSVSGEANMLDQPEFRGGGALSPVLASLSGALLPFLFRQAQPDLDPRVFIGEDLPSADMKDCALVVAPFEGEGRSKGFIAILGPRRMSYNRVIPLVRHAVRVISDLR